MDERTATQAAGSIPLPPPETTGGLPLLAALGARRSARAFSSEPLSPQMLSNLLWAANGVNRPKTGHRTAPSAQDWREIDVYVTTAEGAYRYEAPANALIPVASGDLRVRTGIQDYVATAPVNLVYVADIDRMFMASREDEAFYSATDAAFIAQNVYLYCASAGLAAVVRGLVDRETLAPALGLKRSQRVILAQSVGYPAHPGQTQPQ